MDNVNLNNILSADKKILEIIGAWDAPNLECRDLKREVLGCLDNLELCRYDLLQRERMAGKDTGVDSSLPALIAIHRAAGFVGVDTDWLESIMRSAVSKNQEFATADELDLRVQSVMQRNRYAATDLILIEAMLRTQRVRLTEDHIAGLRVFTGSEAPQMECVKVTRLLNLFAPVTATNRPTQGMDGGRPGFGVAVLARIVRVFGLAE